MRIRGVALSSSFTSAEALYQNEQASYFYFLKEMDGKFKEIYSLHPDTFNLFAKDPNFPKLKQALGEKPVIKSNFDRNKAEIKKRFVIKSLKALENMIGEPIKRQCTVEISKKTEWNGAFDTLLATVSKSSMENKKFVKNSARELFLDHKFM